MEEELGSNKEMLGKCFLTNSLCCVAIFSLVSVFACQEACDALECRGERNMPFDLAQSGCSSPGSSAFHCYCVISIMPELQEDL